MRLGRIVGHLPRVAEAESRGEHLEKPATCVRHGAEQSGGFAWVVAWRDADQAFPHHLADVGLVRRPANTKTPVLTPCYGEKSFLGAN